jgi:cell division protein ZapA
MASIDIEVAGRKYPVACRDGEEEQLRAVAALVDRRARDLGQALGSLSESRHLLLTALTLADDLKEGAPAPTAPELDDDLVAALEVLAARVEQLADRLTPAGA